MKSPQDLNDKLLQDFHGNQLILDDSQIGKLPKVTESAKIFIRARTDLPLVIRITSGGCHGLQYVFEMTENPQECQKLCEDPPILVDLISLDYMWGSLISVKEINGLNQIFIENPRAKQSCGCYNSFTYD